MKATGSKLIAHIAELDGVHAKPRDRTKVTRAEFTNAQDAYYVAIRKLPINLRNCLPDFYHWMIEADNVQIHGLRYTWLTNNQMKRYRMITGPNAVTLLRAWCLQQIGDRDESDGV